MFFVVVNIMSRIFIYVHNTCPRNTLSVTIVVLESRTVMVKRNNTFSTLIKIRFIKSSSRSQHVHKTLLRHNLIRCINTVNAVEIFTEQYRQVSLIVSGSCDVSIRHIFWWLNNAIESIIIVFSLIRYNIIIYTYYHTSGIFVYRTSVLQEMTA